MIGKNHINRIKQEHANAYHPNKDNDQIKKKYTSWKS